MTASAEIKSAAAGTPDREFLVTLATGAGLLAIVAWDQSFWWRSVPDYRFGWLAPAFAGYAVFRRWDEIQAIRADLRSGRTAGGSGIGPRVAALLRWLVGTGFAVATLLFLFGALARAYAGPSHPGSLMLALGAGIMAIGLIYLTAAGTPVGADRPDSALARLRLSAIFLYPALVWLVSMPLLAAWETRLSPFLLHQIERVVLAVFQILRRPVELQGNLFVMRGGPVALETACLGLRSITGCLFGGLFLAEVCFNRWRPRLLIVGAALGYALAANLARVLFLNLWAYKYGPAAIAGVVHDSAGWSVLAATAVGLFFTVNWLERRERRAVAAPGGSREAAE